MKFYLLFVFVIFFSHEVFAKNCQEVRMGVDIGSGSTKIMVAKVDFCKHKILDILLSENKPIPFNEDLEKNVDKNLSPAIIAKGMSTLQEMILKGKIFRPTKSYGVATSVFRKALNGVNVIGNYSKKLKIKLEVISQKDEALLGYLAAKSQVDEKEKNIIAWDIGGGSMQMIGLDKSGKPQIYFGELASVTFKNMMIEVIESKNINEESSPNPIGAKRDQGIALARSYARIHVPATIKDAIRDHVVVGIGGVHGQSIKNQLQLKEMKYTRDELDQVSKIQVLKSDKDLTGDYRASDVTNLLLVQGFMEALGIKAVYIVNASLLQGVMLR